MKINNKELIELKEFQQEKDKFYLLCLISKTEGSMLYSNKSTYIIGRSEINLPTWIWTSENMNDKDILELKKDLGEFLVKGKNSFTCKKSLYEILKDEYKTKDYFEMGYLSCEKLKQINIKERVIRPNYGDKTILAKLWIEEKKEMRNEEVEFSEALEDVNDWIKDSNSYVLKNQNGKIVCKASYNVNDNTAKITHVYTPKDERNKGYCKSLIYEITKKIIEEGLKPILYTDYKYEPSNRAYKSVGYKDEGILINFTIEGE